MGLALNECPPQSNTPFPQCRKRTTIHSNLRFFTPFLPPHAPRCKKEEEESGLFKAYSVGFFSHFMIHFPQKPLRFRAVELKKKMQVPLSSISTFVAILATVFASQTGNTVKLETSTTTEKSFRGPKKAIYRKNPRLFGTPNPTLLLIIGEMRANRISQKKNMSFPCLQSETREKKSNPVLTGGK